MKNVVPFLKVDKGLADEEDGAQIMKPIPDLDDLLDRAVDNGIFGTKYARSSSCRGAGMDAVVDQQFEVARRSSRRPRADHRARGRHPQPGQGRSRGPAQCGPARRARRARRRPGGHAQADAARHRRLLQRLVDHPKVLRVVALSGGYSRDEACARSPATTVSSPASRGR